MNIRIEIKSAEVVQKTIKGKDGKEYLIREQSGWIDLGKAYPQEVRISLDQGMEPYLVGQFVLDRSSLYVDRYGKLTLGRLKLKAAA